MTADAHAAPTHDGSVEDGVHRLRVRVYYEDTDFSGVVYHASYVRFMERGRSDFLRACGIDHRALFRDLGLAFAVRRMTLSFERAATIDDVLTVETRLTEMRGASMTLTQTVLRGTQTIASAEVQAVTIDANGRARRMPETLRARFAPR